ncbi:hypothetical protein E4U35_006842 [Claviceps purpurea]|nr:hypothetical protein E4U35_006842 [Claviceps purpurea]
MYKSNNFPTLSFKLSSVSHWGEWYDTLQTVCDSQLVWHKVDPEIPSTKENDFFVTPVMMTAEECFEVFCAQTKDKVADEYPNRKTALDYYYNEFEAKRDIVMVKQSRLHAVRGWIATTVDPNVHRIAIREIRKKLGRRPADDDADETDDVSVREIVVYLRNRTGILKKYNQHLEEAKRANTSFDNWIAQWNVLYHKAMVEDVGEVKGIEGIESFVDAISVRFDPDWARCTTRVTAAKDYVPDDSSSSSLLKLADDYCRYRQAVRRTATGGNGVHATLDSQSDQGTVSKGTSLDKKNPNCPCGPRLQESLLEARSLPRVRRLTDCR